VEKADIRALKMMNTGAPSPDDRLVDVILPAFNGSRVIRRALDSAFVQRVPLRVIVVDDGSTDDSAQIARSYGERVTVISQANRGVSGARNTGLAEARAPYIAFLDQDDVWEPGKLERQLEVLVAVPDVGLVFTDMQLLEDDGKIVEDGFLHATAPYATLAKTSLGRAAFVLSERLADAVVRFNFISPSTVVARREALEGIGGFDESFRLIDDADCWIRLLTHWRGAAIEERLVRSLVWEGNASLKFDKQLIAERIKLGEKVASRPALFPAGTEGYFRRERALSLYRLGIVALHAGDDPAARAHFRASLRDRFTVSAALALLGAGLPKCVLNPLLQMKRAARLKWTIRVD
jgi:glycosyltransferase involved in cell wall biosynthesis